MADHLGKEGAVQPMDEPLSGLHKILWKKILQWFGACGIVHQAIQLPRDGGLLIFPSAYCLTLSQRLPILWLVAIVDDHPPSQVLKPLKLESSKLAPVPGLLHQ